MAKVTAGMSMSLDGFVAGPNDSPERPLGDGGEILHRWLFRLATWRKRQGYVGGETNRDSEIVDESFRSTGAVVMGRRMFDNRKNLWGDIPPFHTPVFISCHEARDPIAKAGGTTYTFVTDGIGSAVEQARAAAGDKNVSVAGGASVVRQCIEARLLDEMEIHLVPVLLGAGIRLFDGTGIGPVELEMTRVVESPSVTHLRYRVVR